MNRREEYSLYVETQPKKDSGQYDAWAHTADRWGGDPGYHSPLKSLMEKFTVVSRDDLQRAIFDHVDGPFPETSDWVWTTQVHFPVIGTEWIKISGLELGVIFDKFYK